VPPTLKGLLGQLEKLSKCFPGCTLSLCYEATYIGYTLQRDLAEKNYQCDVQALTSYKGIKNLFALTMITEIDDIKRFPHPQKKHPNMATSPHSGEN